MGSYSTSSCQRGPKSGGSSSSTNSDASDRSKSTAPTIYSDRPTPMTGVTMAFDGEEDPKASVTTYTSTNPSVDDLPEPPRYQVTDRKMDIFSPDVIPSNPSTFGQLFPSSRRLLVRHDDATLDGNMNLRVDTMVPQRGGYQQDVTLFHLRMYDLFSRKFSFRRYSRDSGREVCHSERRPVPGSDRHAVFRKSWSSVLASLRPGSSGHGSVPVAEHRRQDSGYKLADDNEEEWADQQLETKTGMDRHQSVLTESTLLEFSNYAHVELRRRGAGQSKRYEFEYWSTRYQWRRECRREGDLRESSYHLINLRTSKPVAHIVPEILAPMEAVEEERKGGWVPPSSMWISDPSVYEKMPDVADVIVATGLVALVDDCIRRKWHSKKHSQLIHPVRSTLSKSIELMGPRRFLDEVFHRRGSA